MIDNWFIAFSMLAVLVVIIACIINWMKLPTDQKIEDVKEWLKWAVTESEKKLHSGTGQLKLRMVYDMFIVKFPELQKYVSFDMFEVWVDDSLNWLNKQLESNQAVKDYVYGENN